MMNLATCPRCSAKIPGDANFCRRCGETLRSPVVSRTAPPPIPAATRVVAAPPPVRRPPPPKAKSGGGIWWIILIGFFCYRSCSSMFDAPKPRRVILPNAPHVPTLPPPRPEIDPREFLTPESADRETGKGSGSSGMVLPLGPYKPQSTTSTTRPSR